MTAIEAIEILRDTPIDIRSTREDDIHTLYATAQGVALEALEKQIPKKPKLVSEDYTMDGILMRDFECTSCGNPYVDDSYCPTCGQRLDWSDTDG